MTTETTSAIAPPDGGDTPKPDGGNGKGKAVAGTAPAAEAPAKAAAGDGASAKAAVPQPAPTPQKPGAAGAPQKPGAAGPGAGARPGPAAAGKAPSAAAERSPERKAALQQIRRQRTRRLAVRLGIFVLLPTLLATVYYSFLASKQYESFAQFSVQTSGSTSTGGLDALLGSVGAHPAAFDMLSVREYIVSRDMLRRLDKEQQFLDHYREPSHDWWARLPARATFEDAYEYYDDVVESDFDTSSFSISLRVQAFSPEKAYQFAEAILRYGEEMVNKLAEKERHDRIAFADEEVKKSEQRLTEAGKKLLALQQKYGELSPQKTAEAALTVRTTLEGELAKARAELMEAKAYMKPTAPKVKALQDRVTALGAQVGNETKRLVNPKSDRAVAESAGEFELATLENQFAQKAYEGALASLASARMDAARKHRYVTVISHPAAAEESTRPKRVLGVLTVFVLCFLAYGVGSLFVAAVREHARV